ncbi:MAG TPA: CDP-diacylglycerol--serine O-phosphatidyltransferase [Blastocatellia bacterium]|nr:CDP-diacylglycerol--serine O-phosphatidyltransferase [Blastocatellia bacterium]HMX27725.1 CDP-diacylglycerol--serine O-phosphatidyltransferase [Blastocatellia bacterium]HMZ18999.1 CDP-diacylglycerol--serine O-phosphatidyltransferase [Blastocatellia bacterium]HNG28313.1 CDP-diacylglycerol--serine O-phosphatidyltransferase [Blastocatellia bacterium]
MSEETQVNPPRHGIRKGVYIIPSAFTIGNIFCGFYAVINAVKGYQAFHTSGQIEQAAHLFDNAARAIGWAFLLDGLDGRIARMTKATSEFGVELDSIADVLTFGIAPAVVAYTWGYGSTPGLERWAWGVSFFFLICGALRLARFNVMARAPRFTVPGSTPKLDKRYFVGLPIPAAALLLASIIHFTPQPIPTYPAEQMQLYTWGLLAAMAILASLMVSTFRYTSFKNVGPKSNKPFITLPLLSLLIAGIYFYSQPVLLVLATIYVMHGPLMKLASLLRRTKRPITNDEPSTVASANADQL